MVIGVAGGCGTTTAAIGLACAALRSGRMPLLVDASGDGREISAMLGFDPRGTRHWSGLVTLTDPPAPDSTRRYLHREAPLDVLLGPAPTSDAAIWPLALSAFLDAYDVVVVDASVRALPPFQYPLPSVPVPVLPRSQPSVDRMAHLLESSWSWPRPCSVMLTPGPMSLNEIRAALPDCTLHPIRLSNATITKCHFGMAHEALGRRSVGRAHDELLSAVLGKRGTGPTWTSRVADALGVPT